jgi:hypothetical protein
METDRYTFGFRGLDLLEDLKRGLESQGYACSVEHETFNGHALWTLVAAPPKKEHPIQFTRRQYD